jgi:hypothetical protein
VWQLWTGDRTPGEVLRLVRATRDQQAAWIAKLSERQAERLAQRAQRKEQHEERRSAKEALFLSIQRGGRTAEEVGRQAGITARQAQRLFEQAQKKIEPEESRPAPKGEKDNDPLAGLSSETKRWLLCAGLDRKEAAEALKAGRFKPIVRPGQVAEALKDGRIYEGAGHWPMKRLRPGLTHAQMKELKTWLDEKGCLWRDDGDARRRRLEGLVKPWTKQELTRHDYDFSPCSGWDKKRDRDKLRLVYEWELSRDLGSGMEACLALSRDKQEAVEEKWSKALEELRRELAHIPEKIVWKTPAEKRRYLRAWAKTPPEPSQLRSVTEWPDISQSAAGQRADFFFKLRDLAAYRLAAAGYSFDQGQKLVLLFDNEESMDRSRAKMRAEREILRRHDALMAWGEAQGSGRQPVPWQVLLWRL